MTREDKNLLIEDLCARLPYKVKCYGFQQKIDGNDNECYGTIKSISNIDSGWQFILNNRVPLNNKKCHEESYHIVKPYLFPLSSMTKEQKKEYELECDKDLITLSEAVSNRTYTKIGISTPLYWGIDWLIKNHFDYRGLIPMGLAIDATGLNIY